MKCKHKWCLMEYQGKTNPVRIEFRFVCSKCMEIRTAWKKLKEEGA